MISRSNTLTLLLLSIIFSTGLCYDDDDDNIIGEIVIDLLAGVMIEECGKYPTCRFYLTFISLTILLTALISCVLSGECRCRPLNNRELRRIGTTYAGMRLRRAFG